MGPEPMSRILRKSCRRGTLAVYLPEWWRRIFMTRPSRLGLKIKLHQVKAISPFAQGADNARGPLERLDCARPHGALTFPFLPTYH